MPDDTNALLRNPIISSHSTPLGELAKLAPPPPPLPPINLPRLVFLCGPSEWAYGVSEVLANQTVKHYVIPFFGRFAEAALVLHQGFELTSISKETKHIFAPEKTIAEFTSELVDWYREHYDERHVMTAIWNETEELRTIVPDYSFIIPDARGSSIQSFVEGRVNRDDCLVVAVADGIYNLTIPFELVRPPLLRPTPDVNETILALRNLCG